MKAPLSIYLPSIIRIAMAFTTAALFGCSNQLISDIDVAPKNFKVHTPFILTGRGIIINTYWGKERKHHVLCLDNNSPSWIKSSAIQYGRSFQKSNRLNFKTATADGTPIQGEVGVCDSLCFENVAFKKVPFYVMPASPKDNRNDDGVFGIEALSKGVWKIDFKKEELSFASSIDSLEQMNSAGLFPATFTQGSILLAVEFGKNNIKEMAVDLGYNGDLLLPADEFKTISSAKKVFTNLGGFTTPASQNLVNSSSFFDTVRINGNWFSSIISTNEVVKERLIGLGFFRRFDFVVFDFIDRRLYVSKKVW